MKKKQSKETGKVTPRHLEQFVKRTIKYLGCDTARISQPCGTFFLIIGTNRNSKTEYDEGRSSGQWTKDGIPIDLDYLEEHVIAHGKNLTELWESVKFYRKLQKERYKKHGLSFATTKA